MRVMALDLGTRTIGIALSDPLGIIANGLENFRYKENDFESCYKRLLEIIAQYKVEDIVIGLPYHMNGDAGDKIEFVTKFANELENRCGIKVNGLDERWTTKLATQYMLEADLSRNKRKKVIDMMSAVIILQDYLDRKGRK